MAIGNFQFGIGFASPTLVLTVAPSLYYPPHRLLNVNPWQDARFASGGKLVLDAGAAAAPLALFVDNVNFPTLQIEYSADCVSWSNLGTNTIAFDYELGRRKAWIAIAPGSVRYFRLTPSGTLDDGDTLIRMGTVLLITTVLTLADNPAEPVTRIIPAVSRLTYAGGGGELNDEGHPRFECTLSSDVFITPATVIPQIGQLLAVPPSSPIVMFRNQNETQYAYCLQRVSAETQVTERYNTGTFGPITLSEGAFRDSAGALGGMMGAGESAGD